MYGGKFDKNITDLVERHEEALRRYVKLLIDANETVRLTGPSDENTLWNHHILDCAAALPFIPDTGRLIDVGTGGGLPGIVWAVCKPQLKVTLLDSIMKKCNRVQQIILNLGLNNVTIVCSRSEDYARLHREIFHAASARAVSEAGVLAEYLSPLVQVKGRLIAFKGPKAAKEIENADGKWGSLGLSPPTLASYDLVDKKRFLVIWSKIAPAPKGIPRGPGRAEKFPWYKM